MIENPSALTKAVAIMAPRRDRKSTRLNSSHTEIYTLSLHDALPICGDRIDEQYRQRLMQGADDREPERADEGGGDYGAAQRSEEHTSELQSHRDLHSFPTRRSSDLR